MSLVLSERNGHLATPDMCVDQVAGDEVALFDAGLLVPRPAHLPAVASGAHFFRGSPFASRKGREMDIESIRVC